MGYSFQDKWKLGQQGTYGYGATAPVPFLPKNFFLQAVEDGGLPPPDPFLDDWRMTEEKLDLYRQALAEFVPEDRPLDVPGIANPYAANMPQWGMPQAGAADSQRMLQANPPMGTRAPEPSAYGADAYTAGAAVSYTNPEIPGISGQAEVMGIQTVGENPTVRTADGRVIPFGEVNFGDFETQGLYKIAAEFPDSATANLFLHVYQQSEVDVPEFLQVYRDVLRKDVQGGADAQKDAADSLFGMPPNNDANGLTKENGLPPFKSVDLASDRVSLLAKSNGRGIMKAVRQQLATDGSKASQGMGDIPYSGLARGKYEDEEVYWEDIQPTPAPTTSSTQTSSSTPGPSPTPKPTAPQYTVNVFKTGDYARNQSIYPGVTESTLMPLDYLKQSQAQLKKEGVIYPGDGIIYHYDPELSYDEDQLNAKGKGKGKRRLETDCVGMYVLPAMMWYSDKMFEYLIKEAKKIKTSTDNAYTSSSHKGKLTKDIIESGKMFDGMVLMGEDDKGEPEHAVIFYKEFEYDGIVHKNVVVDISGFRYKIDPATGRSIVDGDTKRKNAEKTEVRIRSFEEAYKEGRYKYWCAPDYIDYGDQRDPVTGELLTPKKTIDKGKKK